MLLTSKQQTLLSITAAYVGVCLVTLALWNNRDLSIVGCCWSSPKTKTTLEPNAPTCRFRCNFGLAAASSFFSSSTSTTNANANAAAATATRRLVDTTDVETDVDVQSPTVIVMGLPRSGSLQLHEFFQCHGLKSAHYCCDSNQNNNSDEYKTHFYCGTNVRTCGQCVHQNMLHQRAPFDRCGAAPYDVYSQFDVETSQPFAWFLPQHYTLPLLHEAYPNAIWILNTRSSPEQWAASVLHWYSVTQRLFRSLGLDYDGDDDDNSLDATTTNTTATTATTTNKNTGTTMQNNNNNKKKNPRIRLAPIHDLSEAQMTRALNESMARTANATAHARRQSQLAAAYARHSARIQEFVGARRRVKLLIQVSVDDPDAGQVLTRALFPGSTTSDCWKWEAASLDEDWKDLALKL
jgi:hypothetical protein